MSRTLHLKLFSSFLGPSRDSGRIYSIASKLAFQWMCSVKCSFPHSHDSIERGGLCQRIKDALTLVSNPWALSCF